MSFVRLDDVLRPRAGESHEAHTQRILDDIQRTRRATALVWVVALVAFGALILGGLAR